MATPSPALPEKVLQFGTGALLRGLPDLLIEKANRQGIFNGRIVAVKSTAIGDVSAFEKQGNQYTVCIRGIDKGQPVAENIVCSAISRVLSAGAQWAEVLEYAASPDLAVVISNTTEVGIQLVEENVFAGTPGSFPGKLLACLYARFRAFGGDAAKGLVIVPTELVPNNGALLADIVLKLAAWNKLEPGLANWVKSACVFCNALVDRIVPGHPGPEQAKAIQSELGYHDPLLVVAEPYGLWAIEGGAQVASVLSFQQASPEIVVIAPNIERYRERKLRLLNGTHTLSCGLAHLAGFRTVSEAMGEPAMATFVERLMLHEIALAIPFELPPGDAGQFGQQVLDRFRNPAVEHRWLSITLQYTAKMRMRNVPVLLEYYRKFGKPPTCIALGFAAFLCFYRNPEHPVQDAQAGYFIDKWRAMPPEALTEAVLADSGLWGCDLAALPGFSAMVAGFVAAILDKGAYPVLQELLSAQQNQ